MLLKLRAWDAVGQKMVQVTRWNIVGLVESLMLWTGARDMNGNDIYEGDIIRKEECSPDDMAFGFYGSIGVVKYDSSVMGFVIDSADDGFYDNRGMNFTFDRIEIVGNIYENPEILE